MWMFVYVYVYVYVIHQQTLWDNTWFPRVKKIVCDLHMKTVSYTFTPTILIKRWPPLVVDYYHKIKHEQTETGT
jgi:hypothetical protein